MDRTSASQRTRNQRAAVKAEQAYRRYAEIEGMVNGTPYLPTLNWSAPGLRRPYGA